MQKKKFLTLAVAFVFVLQFLLISVSADSADLPDGLSFENYSVVEVDGIDYYCSEVLVLPNGMRCVHCYSDNESSIIYVDYASNKVKIESYTYDNAGEVLSQNVSENNFYSQVSIAVPYVVGDVTESWWGFRYYYNTSSAQDDVYWRLYNPLDTNTDTLYFFAEFNSSEQSYAEGFAECVNEMVAIQNSMNLSSSVQIPIVLLSLGTAPSLSTIIAALAEALLDGISPESVSELYAAKDAAVNYYNTVKRFL